MKLQKKDRKLLYALDSNAREGFSRIGKRIKMSQQMVSYKVKRFIEKDMISQFYTIIDYSRFGYIQFRVYFKTNYFSKDHFKKLVKFFVEHPSTLSVIECHGKWDLIVTFASKNASRFNKRLKEIMYKYPKQLKNYNILTTVVIHEFGREYLAARKKYRNTIVGGDRTILEIDSTDKEILKLMLENARVTSVEISTRLNLDPKTAASRIKRMKERKIIRGYSTRLDLNSIGYAANKILLKYSNLSLAKEKSLVMYCVLNPNITQITKVFGEWDVEINVETQTPEEFREIYLEIRQKFEDIINDFENISIFKTHKKTFLPYSCFEDSPTN